MGVSMNRRAALYAAAALAFTGTARAATIVNDTWLDGTDSDPASPAYSENGLDADGDGNLESAWFQGGVGSLDPVGANGPLRGNMTAGGTSSATWTTYFTPEASPVSLTQGETLRVTWMFSPANVNLSNTSQNFRIALMDSPSTSRVSANGTPGSAAYTGYALFTNMGQTLGNSNPFQLRERVVASGDVLSTGGNWGADGTANSGLANGATSGNDGYDAGANYTLVWELTRTAEDALNIVATMSGTGLDGDGTASVSVTDASPQGFVYDTFVIRPSGATTTAELFDTSLFMVEVVPEPSSIALFGVAGLAALRRSRRRA
jgi:hypothetical protein